MTLIRETTSGARPRRVMQDLVQDAVDAEANTQPVFIGFDVDVGRIVLDGLGQDGVDKAG